MSHELLILAGSPNPRDRERRQATILHAAAAVPGVASWSILTSSAVIAALVETEPVGGSVAKFLPEEAGGWLTLAGSPRGLAVPLDRSSRCGAEDGHVSARLGPDGSVTVATDGVGTIPAYWTIVDGTLLVSTHLASLVSLGLPPRLDERWLVEYLALNHPLGDRTSLEGASILGAGATLLYAEGHVRIARDPLFVPSDDALSDDDAIARFSDVWPNIIADALAGPGRASVSLSGGLDSRKIAEAAVGLGLHPLTFTYGAPPTREAVVAADIAKVLRLPHLSLPVTDDRLLLGAQGMLAALDGAHSPVEMYDLWFADVLRDYTDVIVNGHAGGPLWGDEKAIGSPDAAAVLNRLLTRYGGTLKAAVPFLSPEFAAEAPALLRSSLAESLEPWDFSSRQDMVVYWQIANRQLRWGNMVMVALRRAGLHMEAPFLDSRFLRLAAAFTPDQHRNGRLYLEVQRRAFPRTIGIVRSDDGNRPKALDHLYYSADSSYTRQLAVLTSHHPLSGIRRGWRLGTQRVLGQVRRHTPIAAPADRIDALRSVFPGDVWLRTRTPYAGRFAEFLEAGAEVPLLSSCAVAVAVADVRRGHPPASAAVLGRVAAVRGWSADHTRRAEAFRSLR